jgi:hypothetical protein
MIFGENLIVSLFSHFSTVLSFTFLLPLFYLLPFLFLFPIGSPSASNSPASVISPFSFHHSSTGVKFICTRVTAAQRGGIWVVGKRLLHGKPLFLVMSQCSTLHDVMDIIDNVTKDIKKQ